MLQLKIVSPEKVEFTGEVERARSRLTRSVRDTEQSRSHYLHSPEGSRGV